MKKIFVALTTVFLLLTSSFIRCEEKVIEIASGKPDLLDKLNQTINVEGWTVKLITGAGSGSLGGGVRTYLIVLEKVTSPTSPTSNNKNISDLYRIAIADKF